MTDVDGDHDHDHDHDADQALHRAFVELANAASPRAPLYARLATAAAAHPPTAGLLRHAPPTQRLPVLLFACVHWLLLTRPELDPHRSLRQHYPNLTGASQRAEKIEPGEDDPWPDFRHFCAAQEPLLAELLAHRSTQTNEIGRCALFVPVLAQVAAEVGMLAHLDVGASGGLNLLLDRYRYRYRGGDGSLSEVGPADSPVTLECGVRGALPIPTALPRIVDRAGLDRDPIDLTDDDAADWLRACVWPDQADRFERLTAAIELARAAPPPIVRDDAVDHLATAVGRLDPTAHPTVTTSWVLNYLDAGRQRRFVTELDRLGAERDLTWCATESPNLTPGLPWPEPLEEPALTHVLLTRWRGGHRTVTDLATAHPHGYWLHWS